MALESGTYISDLVATNPVNATDKVQAGDDHIRLLKSTILATFPNLTGAITATQAELNILDGVTASTAELNILDADNTFNLDNATADLDGTTFTANYTTITLTGGSAVVTLSGTEIDLTATTLDFNGAADFSGTVTVAGALTVNAQNIKLTDSSRADFIWHNSGAGSDEKQWRMVAETDGDLVIFTATDGGSGASNAIVLSRSGTAISEIELNATTLDFNGAADFNGSAAFIGPLTVNDYMVTFGASARLYINETDQGTDEKIWGILSNASTLDIRAYTDGFGSSNTSLRILRTGTTIDEIELNATTLDFNGNLDVDGSGHNISGGLNAEPESRSITDTGNTAATDQGIVVRMTAGASKTFTLDGDPPTDAVVMLDNSSGNTWTIAASGTLIWAATAGTGNRTLADDGLAVAIHRGSGVWVIGGSGLS